MNEKIQKLRKLAERYALDSPSPMNAAEFDEIFDEIFADLIVRECINVIGESRESRQTAMYYRHRIAEHFGVE